MDVRIQTLLRADGWVRTFVRRHWQRLLRIRERIRFSEETFHLLLAGVVGVIGGLVNLVFTLTLQGFSLLVLGQTPTNLEELEALSPWVRLAAPPLGGLFAGMVLFWGLRLVGPQGSNNLLEVVYAGDGRLRMRSALVKAISSIISLGTGASLGREGAVTQLSAVLASKGGQLAHWHPYRLRLLVACGAASGISAAYNAPIAGAVFAAQIVLGNFSMSLFAPLVFASVVATMVSRTFFGINPWYEVPSFDFTRVTQLPWFLILGIFSGALGAAFLRLLRYSEELFGRLSIPIYGRLTLSGLCVGALAVVYPGVWGNGYGATNVILEAQLTIAGLLGLFAAKLLATLATVGSGAVGGVFTPTLFLGASLGSLFGTLLHQAGYALAIPTGVFALTGMGSVLAATIHSPLLAVIIIFEISLNYSIMPPLMLACTVATIMARRFHPENIYTEPLRRKGVKAESDSNQPGVATQRKVGDLMRAPVPPLAETASFREIADRFLTNPNNFLPVVDKTERLIGVVSLHDLKEFLNYGPELYGVIAIDVMRPPPACVMPNQRLIDVLPIVLSSELRNIPVVNNLVEFRLVGALERSEALSILSEAIATGGHPRE